MMNTWPVRRSCSSTPWNAEARSPVRMMLSVPIGFSGFMR
jgi:hypothetical protein